MAGKSKVSDKGFPCIIYGLKVKEKEPSLQCEICECWSHAQCEKISEEVMQVLQREFSLVLHEVQLWRWEDVEGSDEDARKNGRC